MRRKTNTLACWIKAAFHRDIIYVSNITGENKWHYLKAIMYRLTFPFLLNGKCSLKTSPVSIRLRKGKQSHSLI